MKATLFFSSVIILCMLFSAYIVALEKIEVREPVVAGAFYPSSASELNKMVDGFFANVKKEKFQGKLVALIAPHAGYQYSGQIAAYAFKQLEGMSFDTVVIIGPSHRARFEGVSVYPKGAYKTPLGIVDVDAAFAAELQKQNKNIRFYPKAHAQEHCIEVEIPFLQKTLSKFKIAPILMWDFSKKNCNMFSDALVKVLQGKNALLVASSDMSHYPSYEDACKVDKATIEAVKTLNIDTLRKNDEKQMGMGIRNLHCTLCGRGPVLVVMQVAKKLGADSVAVLKYANSGDVPIGDKSQVVGYMAIAIKSDESQR